MQNCKHTTHNNNLSNIRFSKTPIMPTKELPPLINNQRSTDKRFSKDECFQAARVACENAFPRSSRHIKGEKDEKDGNKTGRSVTEVENSASLSSSRYSMTKLSPSLAAAMLSLPWPPPSDPVCPENSRTELSENVESENILRVNDTTSKLSSSRKVFRKKKCNKASESRSGESKDRAYTPFHMPKFHEVHTSWPGFDHEPLPNWQEKYMIAKSYPKRLEDALGSPSSLPKEILSRPSYILNDDNGNSESLQPLKSSPHKSHPSSKSDTGTKRNSSKPRPRLRVERIGSCIK